jgi:acetyl esterase
MTLHPGAKQYVDIVNAAPPIWEMSVEEARRAVDDETLAAFGRVEEVAQVVDELIDDVLPVRVYRPAATGSLPAVVYLHGGGWVVGSIASHDPVCRAIAARTPAVVVSVGYRLAPEHPFPAAVEDAWAATLWTARREQGQLAVAGDSAGGNLAAVVAVRARDRGLPLALQALIYPVIDFDLDSPGYLAKGTGLNLTRAKMEWYWRRYLGDAAGNHPEASPLRAADLTGVAPALVQVAEYDPLCHEGEQYARALERAGVQVRVTRYEGQIHGFVRLRTYCGDAADAAIEEIASALRQDGDRLDLDQPVAVHEA